MLRVSLPVSLQPMAEMFWHVGDVVRKLRQAHQWTQKELARRAGVHHNTIVRLEDGDEGVQGRTLKQVADALGVTPKELWTLVPSEPLTLRETQPADASAAPDGPPFRRSDGSLSPDTRRQDVGPPSGPDRRKKTG